ncbi:hypothetical protein C8R47DRAFT_974022 [Mycena vitilis]|nr:hypothetical protein C8R47DRAFT_974022 [Mycena vitilis]
MWDRGLHTVKELLDSDVGLRLPLYDLSRESTTTAWTSVEYQFAAAESPSRKDDRDSLYGMRALTSLGTYDTRYTDVGDIIFWGSKVHASFPAGSTFLFPSWWMPYSFTMVDRDETHYLIMQQMDAGLDRWVENGGKTDEDWESDSSPAEKKEREEARDSRRDDILKLFSSLDDFAGAHSSITA